MNEAIAPHLLLFLLFYLSQNGTKLVFYGAVPYPLLGISISLPRQMSVII